MAIAEKVSAAAQRSVMRYKKDASGHEHKGKGPGGGQFTGTGGGGGAVDVLPHLAGKKLNKSNAAALAKLQQQRTASIAKTAAIGQGLADLRQQTNGIGTATRKPGVPGQQMSLFDAAPGQKPLPNTADNIVEEQQQQPTTPPPPGKVYNPDPAEGKAARVGVPGDVVPPPPKMVPRLPNLNPDERAIEHKFATMFETDPDGMAGQLVQAMQNGMGDGPNIFATDEAKGLLPEWKGSKVTGPDGKSDLSPETKAFRSKYNTALHQTANAVTKRAFMKYLDDVVTKLPDDQRQVLVTAGGVAAGKGYAIANVGAVNEISKLAAATWDSAGEQNSTELPWIAEECKKRGIKMTAVYVHSNPQETWENPARGVIERAGKKGRMVDARVFADSYTHGARNFHAFHQKYANDPSVRSVILDNTQKVPSMLDAVPTQMLTMDPDALYSRCLTALEAPNVPEPVKQGGSAGTRIWGAPNAAPAA